MRAVMPKLVRCRVLLFQELATPSSRECDTEHHICIERRSPLGREQPKGQCRHERERGRLTSHWIIVPLSWDWPQMQRI